MTVSDERGFTYRKGDTLRFIHTEPVAFGRPTRKKLFRNGHFAIVLTDPFEVDQSLPGRPLSGYTPDQKRADQRSVVIVVLCEDGTLIHTSLGFNFLPRSVDWFERIG